MEEIDKAAVLGVNMVCDVIKDDTRLLTQLLFSALHLYPMSRTDEDNVVVRIAATLEDYLGDLGTSLLSL